uniref:Uncharacterized protein n=1 Tax=Anguilla anguilla TaxID=7936 RepID=A0A0E9QRH9_ANGAN
MSTTHTQFSVKTAVKQKCLSSWQTKKLISG